MVSENAYMVALPPPPTHLQPQSISGNLVCLHLLVCNVWDGNIVSFPLLSACRECFEDLLSRCP